MQCDFVDVVVVVAELKAEAARIESETELECQTQAREAEVAFLREQNDLQVFKAKALSKVEVCSPAKELLCVVTWNGRV